MQERQLKLSRWMVSALAFGLVLLPVRAALADCANCCMGTYTGTYITDTGCNIGGSNCTPTVHNWQLTRQCKKYNCFSPTTTGWDHPSWTQTGNCCSTVDVPNECCLVHPPNNRAQTLSENYL